ncbi:MAG: hypothetical protein MR871_13415 [Lachnospiraceae bacterium]|nr:hypothetical protein [Lachnospiraceae bacterium]
MEKGKQIFIENQIDMILLDVNLQDGEGFSQMRLKKHMACYSNSREGSNVSSLRRQSIW